MASSVISVPITAKSPLSSSRMSGQRRPPEQGWMERRLRRNMVGTFDCRDSGSDGDPHLGRSKFGAKADLKEARVKLRIRNVKPPRNLLGPVVRQFRERAGLTQPMLVARLNLLGWDLSRGTLAKIEARIRWIADFEVVQLAKALGVTPGELFNAIAAERKSGMDASRRTRTG
jgi:hypothetical protein